MKKEQLPLVSNFLSYLLLKIDSELQSAATCSIMRLYDS